MNRSTASAMCGMLGAGLGLMLRLCDILPRFQESPGYFQSQWSVVFECAGHYLALLLWRPQRLVFLDVACIDQDVEVLKGEALISMGAILPLGHPLATHLFQFWFETQFCGFKFHLVEDNFFWPVFPSKGRARHRCRCFGMPPGTRDAYLSNLFWGNT